MKHCPACNTTFADDELIYCTDDGTVLVPGDGSYNSESQATRAFADQPPTVAMPPPRPTQYGVGASSNQPQQPQPYGWANSSPPAWVPPPVQQFAPLPVRQQQTQNMAIVSLVLGIASITFGWICGGLILAPAAVILALVALSQVKRNPAQYGGKPMALGGLITGGIVLLVHAVIIAIWIVAMIISAASN
jgi:hypothetical protein